MDLVGVAQITEDRDKENSLCLEISQFENEYSNIDFKNFMIEKISVIQFQWNQKKVFVLSEIVIPSEIIVIENLKIGCQLYWSFIIFI